MRPAALVRRLLGLVGLEVYRVRHSRVFAWRPDGRVTPLSPEGGFFYQPCIHPLGEAVVYHGSRRGPLRIWVADLATGEATPLTGESSSAVHPSYSWDGGRIVFASDRAWGEAPLDAGDLRGSRLRQVRLNLYVANGDGSDCRQITFGEGIDRRPCFRPDGRAVAFLSNHSQRPDLWITDLDGREQPHCLDVAAQGWNPGRPWFAADARRIFFYGRSQAARNARICWVPAEGGAVQPLPADDRGDSHGPFVDWDGRALIMHSTRSGRFNIWELPLEGGPPRPLFPPGFAEALHATRSRGGVVAFDVPGRGPLRVARRPGRPRIRSSRPAV